MGDLGEDVGGVDRLKTCPFPDGQPYYVPVAIQKADKGTPGVSLKREKTASRSRKEGAHIAQGRQDSLGTRDLYCYIEWCHLGLSGQFFKK